MKLIIIATTLLVVVAITIFLVNCSRTSTKETKTLEQKLDALKECGLQLTAPFTVKDLLASIDRAEFEKPGFELVLAGLGMTEEQEPWRYHSVNVWDFDTECIENHGSYKKIAERMVEMSQGSLRLEDIKDHVDIEKGEARLSFTFKGKPIKMDFVVKDDWVDPAIFPRFVDLLSQSDPSKIYLYHDLGGGQDCIISCVKKTEFECLKGKGLHFEPLH